MRALVAVGLSMALGAGMGCSSGDSLNNSAGLPPWMLPGDSDGDDGEPSATDDGSPATDSSGGGGDGTGSATTGPVGTSGAGSTSGMPPSGSSDGDPMDDSQGGTFGGDDGGGMQPANGWWAHCIPGAIGCDAGFACLSTDAGDDGVCTMACNPPGDPGGCGMSPGGTSSPVCLSVGGDSVCALGCEGGQTCPSGMVCVAETDDSGPISICL